MFKGVSPDHQTPWNLENLKGAIAFAGQSIKSLEIVNGGAAIGILTFYGNIAPCHAIADPHMAAEALKAFGAGVALATFSAIVAYLAMSWAAIGPPGKGEVTLRGIAMLLAIASAFAFVTGLYDIGLSFEHPEWSKRPAWCENLSSPPPMLKAQ